MWNVKLNIERISMSTLRWNSSALWYIVMIMETYIHQHAYTDVYTHFYKLYFEGLYNNYIHCNECYKDVYNIV